MKKLSSKINKAELKGKIEAIIFAGGEPIAIDRIAQVLEIKTIEVSELIDELCEKYNTSSGGVMLIKMDAKVQFCTNPAYIEPVQAALDLKRNTPLSQAALEVLAVVAYNQPVTKAFVEQVRGVDCSWGITTLMQKGLVEEKGRLELPGRPLLYGTTDDFLRCTGISSLDELPEVPKSQNTQDNQEDVEEFVQTTL